MRSAAIVAALGAAVAVSAECNSSAGDGLRSFTACGTIQGTLSVCNTLSGNPQTSCTCSVYSSQSDCYGSWSSQFCPDGTYKYQNDFMSGNCGGSMATATAAAGSASSKASSAIASATSKGASAASKASEAVSSGASAASSAASSAGSAASSALESASSAVASATSNAGVPAAAGTGAERFVFALAGVIAAGVGGLAIVL